jgi:DNA-binding response OmpR family regulator
MAYKILVVDDETTLLHTVQAYLEREGYTVQTATDGRAALHAFRRFGPDLVVLDIMLPEIGEYNGMRAIPGAWAGSSIFPI